jgi:CDP-glucose 4,6-dehydratase
MSAALRAAYQGRTVLVTGHTGFKGAWLCAWLHALGARVVGYALEPPSEPSAFAALRLAKRIEDVRGDVRDAAALQALVERRQPEYVFHLAAQARVRAGFDDPRGTFDVNFMGTVNLLEAARRTGSARALVVVTSDKCYRNRESGRPFVEDDVLGGHEAYGGSKAAAEIAVEVYADARFHQACGSARPLALASARAGNVVGGGDWGQDRLVPDVVRAIATSRPLRVRYPRAVRPWQHVLEPLSGYLWLGARLASATGLPRALNFGPPSDAACSVTDLVARLKALWPARTLTVEIEPGNDGAEAQALRLDAGLAGRTLGWRPLLPIDEALRVTVEWYRAFYERPGVDVIGLTNWQIEAYTALAAERGLAWAQG